jgi:hypothetical protein
VVYLIVITANFDAIIWILVLCLTVNPTYDEPTGSGSRL